jgi:hypothetical protein
VGSVINEKQVTETIPLQDDGEDGESNHTGKKNFVLVNLLLTILFPLDPSNANLEFDLQANPDTDDFDDAEWDEDFGGLDGAENGQNGESLSTQSSSTTMSNKTSKRSFEEVDLEEAQEESNPVSPGKMLLCHFTVSELLTCDF